LRRIPPTRPTAPRILRLRNRQHSARLLGPLPLPSVRPQARRAVAAVTVQRAAAAALFDLAVSRVHSAGRNRSSGEKPEFPAPALERSVRDVIVIVIVIGSSSGTRAACAEEDERARAADGLVYGTLIGRNSGFRLTSSACRCHARAGGEFSREISRPTETPRHARSGKRASGLHDPMVHEAAYATLLPIFRSICGP